MLLTCVLLICLFLFWLVVLIVLRFWLVVLIVEIVLAVSPRQVHPVVCFGRLSSPGSPSCLFWSSLLARLTQSFVLAISPRQVHPVVCFGRLSSPGSPSLLFWSSLFDRSTQSFVLVVSLCQVHPVEQPQGSQTHPHRKQTGVPLFLLSGNVWP